MAKAEYRSAVRSRKLINGALADLLQEKPLDKITVTDVVNRAEINRGTFYAHYADIPDVINHLIQQTFSNLREVLSDPNQALTDTAHDMLVRIQRILEEDLDLYRKIMNSSAAPLMYEQLIQIVLNYLVQQETKYGFPSQEDRILTMRFCAGGLSTLYRDWFAGKFSFSLDELTQRCEHLMLSVINSIHPDP